jgi:hypothetical protein
MIKSLIRNAAAGAVLVALAAPVGRAQELDARWRAWTGCWTPVAADAPIASAGTVCVVPAAGTSGVDVMSVSGSQVVDRMRIVADGAPHEVRQSECSGTTSADWSTTGTRVYVKESLMCGTTARRELTVMSFTQQYQWLDVRGVSSGGSQGVAVARYELLTDSTGLPADVLPAFRMRGPAANNALLAASAPLTLGDISDVSAKTDSGVTATWLVERTRGAKLSIDGKQLAMLADQGVAPSVIDVIVALAYPENFALSGSSLDPQLIPRQASQQTARYDRYRSSVQWYDPYFGPMYGYYYSPYYYGYRTGYGYYSPYGYYGGGYYGGGYYPGGGPIVIVNNPDGGGTSGGSGASHGRVVKGKGYSSGGSSSDGGSTRTTSSSSGSSSGGSSGSSSGSASGGSSSGGSSTGRTAVRKPPL